MVLTEAGAERADRTVSLSHVLWSKVCQAGLTLTSSRGGKQLVVLTLISSVTSLDNSVCVFLCVCFWSGRERERERTDKQFSLPPA